MTDLRERLEQYLEKISVPPRISQLTPDASTREYFRIGWKGSTAIVCVYPESFIAVEQSYIDVTNLFRKCGLPVAEMLDHDEKLGIIVLEDLGDRILRDELSVADESEREQLIDRAIVLIPQIQAATQTAYDIGSIASKLKFDNEKLLWELNFFKTNYFTTYLKQPLSPEIDAAIEGEFIELVRELETKAKVLCHRDFHAANLMIGPHNDLRIIDHQDARIGSAAYDLVSLLLDRVTEPPTAEWIADKQLLFLSERERIGLERIDEADFIEEFRLQTVQRCLKAVGTFSYQSVNRGKNYFVPFIKPMFQIVSKALDDLNRFPNLMSLIKEQF